MGKILLWYLVTQGYSLLSVFRANCEMSLSILESLIFLGGIHGLILACIVALGPKYKMLAANKFLAMFIAAFSLLIVRNVFEIKGVLPVFSYLSLLSNVLIPVLGPAIFFYVSYLCGHKSRLLKQDFMHVVPFIAYLMVVQIVSGLGVSSGEDLQRYAALFWLVNVLQITVLLLFFFYFGNSIRLLLLAHRELIAQYSCKMKVGVHWLTFLLLSIAFIVAIWVGVFAADVEVLKPEQSTSTLLYFWLVMSMLVYCIGYYGLLQPEVLSLDFNAATSRKNEVSFSDEQLKATVKQLKKLMLDEKPYLSHDLNLNQLAELMSLKAKQLTFVINKGLNTSFYDFVNQHRIEHIKTRLQRPEAVQEKLEIIAYESGIRSSSTFNRLFKKYVKQTPNQFRQAFQNTSGAI